MMMENIVELEIIYVLSPFSFMVVFSKAFTEKAIAIIIIPNWLSQHWHNQILSLATAVLEIKPKESNLRLTHKPSTMHLLSS